MSNNVNDEVGGMPWVIILLASVGAVAGASTLGMFGSVIFGLIGAAIGGGISAKISAGTGQEQTQPSVKAFDGLVLALPLRAVCAGVEAGLHESEILESKFVAGYMYGFPSKIIKDNPVVGARMLRGLLTAVYGDRKAEVILREVSAGLRADDQQITLGANVGAVDGSTHFSAHENNQNAKISTNGLERAFAEGRVSAEKIL